MTIDELDSQVRGISGRWPVPPGVWSYSSLREAEDCPRRWALSRANYPGMWEGSGYPSRPGGTALLGVAVHRCLEWILEGFQSSGCSGPRDPKATQVLRTLGGYSELIERAVDEVLGDLHRNPRMSRRIPDLRVWIGRNMPDVRLRVQSLVAKMQMVPPVSDPPDPGAGKADSGQQGIDVLGEGSHPEVELRADALAMRGVVDLITLSGNSCAITDYKTGREHEYHAEQLRMYQVLWMLDGRRNPDRLPVRSLQVVYPHKTTLVPPLTAEELNAFIDELHERMQAMREELASRPPAAKPSHTNCDHCAVRHLCEDYWKSDLTADLSTGDFGDAEVRILARQGGRSWRVRHRQTGVQTLLHVASGEVGFQPGEDVRIVDVAFGRPDPEEPPVMTATPASESYVIS